MRIHGYPKLTLAIGQKNPPRLKVSRKISAISSDKSLKQMGFQ